MLLATEWEASWQVMLAWSVIGFSVGITLAVLASIVSMVLDERRAKKAQRLKKDKEEYTKALAKSLVEEWQRKHHPNP